MKRFSTAAMLAVFGFITAGPVHAATPEEPVAVVVQGVSPEVARAIKRQASQGKTALLRYLDRGRFAYEVRVGQGAKDAKASQVPVVVAKQ